MDVRVLGPVEAWKDGRKLHLPRRQQRLILGVLSIEANRPISADRLIGVLWGYQPPDRARAVLHTRVSELRAAIGNLIPTTEQPQLITGSGSYTLQMNPDAVDANRFRNLSRSWREAPSREAARRMLREAVGLWRGPLFGGHPSDGTYDSLARGWESMRLTAHEDLFSLELKLDNHQDVVDEVVELSKAHPERERLMGQAMLALHRAGRTSQSLREYDQWRRWLRDELGADPGPEVTKLYLDILSSNPSLLVPGESKPAVFEAEPADDLPEPQRFTTATPRLLPPDIADFTGRSDHLTWISSRLGERAAKAAVIVAIVGRGGIGKTALAVHVGHRERQAFPDGQLFMDLGGHAGDDAIRPFEVLGRFLRSLGVDGSAIPKSLEERSELYRDLLSERRVLVVLDNAASDEQVLPVIPGGSTCAVILTSRQRLGATIGAQTIGLEVFEPEQAVALLERMLGAARVSAEPEAVAELCDQCGHLPLAIRIVGAKLANKPHWSISKLVGLLANERNRLAYFAHGHLDVGATISFSYSGLTPAARRLLCLLGDLNLADTPVWLAAALLDIATADAEELLEQLFDAQLADVSGQDVGGSPRYRCHDLVRLFARDRALAEEPPAELQAARGRAYGAWLYVADVCYRAIYGGPYQNIQGTTKRWPVEDHVLSTIAADPLRWFDIEWRSIAVMVALAGVHKDHEFSWELACTTSPMFQMRRQFDAWHDILRTALSTTQRVGDVRGEAALRYRLGWVLTDLTELEQARQEFYTSADLFEQAGDRHGRATVGAYLGMIERLLGDDDRALQLYQQAQGVLHDVSDHGGEAFTLRAIGQIHTQRKSYSEADTHLARALAIYRACGARQGEAQVSFWQSMLRLDEGRHEEALSGFEAALAICRAVGDRPGEAQCLRGLGLIQQRQGNIDRARATLSEALLLVRQPRSTSLEVHIRAALDQL